MPDPKEDLGDPERDPRNQQDVGAMPGSFVDSAQNMPGDQPVDDTPPSKAVADGTRSPEELDDPAHDDPAHDD